MQKSNGKSDKTITINEADFELLTSLVNTYNYFSWRFGHSDNATPTIVNVTDLINNSIDRVAQQSNQDYGLLLSEAQRISLQNLDLLTSAKQVRVSDRSYEFITEAVNKLRNLANLDVEIEPNNVVMAYVTLFMFVTCHKFMRESSEEKYLDIVQTPNLNLNTQFKYIIRTGLCKENAIAVSNTFHFIVTIPNQA